MVFDMSPYLDAIENELKDVLTTTDPNAALMFEMMRYHMGWLDEDLLPFDAPRGKRLRPVMCLLACETFSNEWRAALPAAGALELVHNFSLLHDDIQDVSETRRHRKTAWKLWGVPQAINTGDAMWTMSRLCGYRMADRGVAADTTLRVMRLMDETCLKLCTGQHMDMSFEQRDDVSLEEYLAMIGGKTAALLEVSLAAGSTVGGASDIQTSQMAGFGRELGLTFQIVDDILGIWGDPAITGKSAASDVLTRKKTLPVLYALSQDHPASQKLKQIYYSDKAQPNVSEVLSLLDELEARDYAESEAQKHQVVTMAYLDALHLENSAIQSLRTLALSLLKRNT